jgi:hypothetical protein
MNGVEFGIDMARETNEAIFVGEILHRSIDYTMFKS